MQLLFLLEVLYFPLGQLAHFVQILTNLPEQYLPALQSVAVTQLPHAINTIVCSRRRPGCTAIVSASGTEFHGRSRRLPRASPTTGTALGVPSRRSTHRSGRGGPRPTTSPSGNTCHRQLSFDETAGLGEAGGPGAAAPASWGCVVLPLGPLHDPVRRDQGAAPRARGPPAAEVRAL